MKQRERILVALLVTAAAVGLGFRMLPEDFFEGGAGLGGELDTTRRAFRDAREWLERGPEIELEYQRVQAQFPERTGVQTPGSTFSIMMESLLREHGNPSPKLKQPQEIRIKDVEDYYYIDLEFRVNGRAQKMIDLLAELRRKGLQIKNFKMAKNRTNAESDFLIMDVTVSRLAKFDESELEKRRNDQRRGRRR